MPVMSRIYSIPMKKENIGTIASVELPRDFVATGPAGATPTGVAWEMVFANRIHNDIEIVFKYRGVPINEAARKVLNYLLHKQERDSLEVEEILALHTVLGVATVGDNQYTNSNPPGSLEGPRFHLDRIGVRKVQDKFVLSVEGKFANNHTYRGIYYPAGVEGRVMEELFLEVPGKYQAAPYIDEFESLLGSIKWRR